MDKYEKAIAEIMNDETMHPLVKINKIQMIEFARDNPKLYDGMLKVFKKYKDKKGTMTETKEA